MTDLSNKKLVEIIDSSIENFKGDLTELAKAIGMLAIGRKFGWKVVYLIHSKKTIKKYEKILGIDLRETIVDVGPRAEKSYAWKAMQKVTNFWKAVSGEIPGIRSPNTVDAKKKPENKNGS